MAACASVSVALTHCAGGSQPPDSAGESEDQAQPQIADGAVRLPAPRWPLTAACASVSTTLTDCVSVGAGFSRSRLSTACTVSLACRHGRPCRRVGPSAAGRCCTAGASPLAHRFRSPARTRDASPLLCSRRPVSSRSWSRQMLSTATAASWCTARTILRRSCRLCWIAWRQHRPLPRFCRRSNRPRCKQALCEMHSSCVKPPVHCDSLVACTTFEFLNQTSMPQ